MNVTEPGVYDLADDDYLADPVPRELGGSLSHSGAKLLLQSPALFRHRQTNPQPFKAVFDFGHAAHALVLGVGATIREVEADSWRTNAAKEAADAARASGETPLLSADCRRVEQMAVALQKHPTALGFLRNAGEPEKSLFTVDAETGVWLRGKLDHYPTPDDEHRPVLVDYKTTTDANPARFGKALAAYAYHSQAAWYLDLYARVTGRDDAGFVFVVQEKDPPYLVSVVEPDAYALAVGATENRAAIDLYVQCMTDDEWPGYSLDVELVTLPRYYTPRTVTPKEYVA